MRLFIALPLPEDTREALDRITGQLRPLGGKVKWVAAGNIHITVRFLGETDEGRIDDLKQMMNMIASSFTAADTIINRLGGFPNLKRPRVIWAGLAEDETVEMLGQLAHQIELAVRTLRFEPEKKGFNPHITLGRVREPRGLDELLQSIRDYRFEPISLRLDRLVLFKSTLTSRGPVYEPLHTARLGEERLGG